MIYVGFEEVCGVFVGGLWYFVVFSATLEKCLRISNSVVIQEQLDLALHCFVHV